MDNKIVTARFATDDNYVNVYDVYQWDYGQVLRIEGLKLPNMVEIHFSLEETSGEAKTRIGVTKDGVTDVVIPDGFLENEGIGDNYKIFVWVYVADKESGSTEYKITIHVKARAKPEITHGGQDGEVFQEAVEAVRDAAKRAAESEKQAEGYAHGREDIPERAEDNAMYYAGKASEDAKKTARDRAEVERLVESVSGIDEQVAKVEKLSKDAQEAATQAGTSAEQAELHKQAAETASSAAQTAAQETEADRTSVEKTKETVENLSAQVQKNKESVDKTAQDFALNTQQALADVNNAGQTQTERVQTAGNTVVENIKTAQDTATRAVETAKTEAVKAVQTEGNKQVKAVADKGKEVLEAIPNFDAKLDTKLDKNQGAEHAGKALVVGEDGNVVPGKPQTEGVGDAADAIVNTASGTLLNIKDSAERKNKGFEMSGKTTQDGTPTPDTPVEIVNAGRLNSDTGKYEVDVKITGKNLFDMNKFIDTCNFTKNEDGTFRIDKFVKRYDCFMPANTILSIEVLKVEDSSGTAVLELFYEDGKNTYIGFNQVGVKTFLIQKDVAYIKVLAYRNHEYKYIQLEKGTVATPYEPYKEQILTLTSDRPLTKWDRLVEQNGQIGWLYNTGEIMLSEIALWSVQKDNLPDNRTQRIYAILDNAIKNQHCYATKYCSEEPSVSSIKHKDYECITICNGNYLTLKVDRNIGTTSEDYVNYFRENDDKVIYNSTEQEFAPLPQPEQDTIRALQTYYPTTVVTNSEDTEMQLTYVADTKNYTDRKIEEAVSAQVQNLANLLSLMPLSTQAAMIENDTNNILDMEVQE